MGMEMKCRRAFLILVLVVAILFVPVIPAHRINGPHFHGTITENGPIVGFGRGSCVEQMLVSVFYMLTVLGTKLVLTTAAQCF